MSNAESIQSLSVQIYPTYVPRESCDKTWQLDCQDFFHIQKSNTFGALIRNNFKIFWRSYFVFTTLEVVFIISYFLFILIIFIPRSIFWYYICWSGLLEVLGVACGMPVPIIQCWQHFTHISWKTSDVLEFPLEVRSRQKQGGGLVSHIPISMGTQLVNKLWRNLKRSGTGKYFLKQRKEWRALGCLKHNGRTWRIALVIIYSSRTSLLKYPAAQS